MRVAWVHPTWRDLVIERLAGDAGLRARFLGRCGPHGVALALSTQGGHFGERHLPLIARDEDWDAVGDRIYALAPELEPREATTVLRAIDHLLEATLDDAVLAGEAAALARMVLERFDELWETAHAAVALPCIDAWLSAAARLRPTPPPTFLAVTWANLLPTHLPDVGDFAEVQRFTDWRALCEMVRTHSPEVLSELGYSAAQDDLMAAFRRRERTEPAVLAQISASPELESFIEESRARRTSDNVVRRVLVDL